MEEKRKKNVKKKWKGPGAVWAMLGQNSGLVDGFTWAYFQKNGLGLKGKDLKGVKGRNE